MIGGFGISERRACTIFGVDRTSVRYAPRRSDDGDPIGRGCVRSRPNVVASAIDGLASCWPVKGWS